jgi:hypothetical protein
MKLGDNALREQPRDASIRNESNRFDAPDAIGVQKRDRLGLPP